MEPLHDLPIQHTVVHVLPVHPADEEPLHNQPAVEHPLHDHPNLSAVLHNQPVHPELDVPADLPDPPDLDQEKTQKEQKGVQEEIQLPGYSMKLMFRK